VKRAIIAAKGEVLLTKLGSKKRQFIDLNNDNDSLTKLALQSQSITCIFKDDGELKKEDWIDIMKSGSNNSKARARLDILEQKMNTINQKLDQSSIETKQLLQSNLETKQLLL
jgi:hypothetical protein